MKYIMVGLNTVPPPYWAIPLRPHCPTVVGLKSSLVDYFRLVILNLPIGACDPVM